MYMRAMLILSLLPMEVLARGYHSSSGGDPLTSSLGLFLVTGCLIADVKESDKWCDKVGVLLVILALLCLPLMLAGIWLGLFIVIIDIAIMYVVYKLN